MLDKELLKSYTKLSFDEKMKQDFLIEVANTLGFYEKNIEEAVANQKRILLRLKEEINISNKNEISNNELSKLYDERRKEVYNLITEFNNSFEVASKYQYYMNVQKEALKFRGFNYNYYGILPKIIIN